MATDQPQFDSDLKAMQQPVEALTGAKAAKSAGDKADPLAELLAALSGGGQAMSGIPIPAMVALVQALMQGKAGGPAAG